MGEFEDCPTMKTLILQQFRPLHTQVNCNLNTKVLVAMTTQAAVWTSFRLHIKKPQSVCAVCAGLLVV